MFLRNLPLELHTESQRMHGRALIFSVASIKRTDMGNVYTLEESKEKTYMRNELLRITGPDAPPVEADPTEAVGPLYAPGARRLRRVPPEKLVQ